jgi:hypothetical protein
MHADDGPSWEARDGDDGPGYRYQVFTQNTEDEEFIRYQVRGTIDATPEELRSSVRAVTANPDNAPAGQTLRMIESTPAGFVVHTMIELPFLDDREIVSRGEGSADADTGIHRIEWRAVDDERVPHAEDVVRVDEAAGFWEFVPLEDGRTRVTYETFVDLGGSIPMWVVNAIMPGMVAGNFEDVAAEARKRAAHVGAGPPEP